MDKETESDILIERTRKYRKSLLTFSASLSVILLFDIEVVKIEPLGINNMNSEAISSIIAVGIIYLLVSFIFYYKLDILASNINYLFRSRYIDKDDPRLATIQKNLRGEIAHGINRLLSQEAKNQKFEKLLDFVLPVTMASISLFLWVLHFFLEVGFLTTLNQ